MIELRDMNEVENVFYFAYEKILPVYFPDTPRERCYKLLKTQERIGNYYADFVFFDTIVIEIDGHDYHSTREQRAHDYKRERFLLMKGYFIVRFTATEVFKNPVHCWIEVILVYMALLNRDKKHMELGWKNAECNFDLYGNFDYAKDNA